MSYYPVYLDLRGRRCVVVGGGLVAERKVNSLLEAEAKVVVISPRLTPGLQALVAGGRIAWTERTYRSGDLAGAFLAVGAAGERSVNRRVWQEATRRGVLVNVVDDPSHCDFIMPSVVRRGDLIVAVSTGGRAPALAVRLRQWLEGVLGWEYARFLEMAGGVRAQMAARYPDPGERRQMWYRLVDSDVLGLLRRGDEEAAWRRVEEIIGFHPRDVRLRSVGMDASGEGADGA